MKAPQLFCCSMALAVGLAGCRGADRPSSDAAKTAKEVASDVKVETTKVAAKAGDELVDAWLTTKIQSKFVADRDIKATDIAVSARNGVVTLKGRVQNEPMRSLAVAVARNTDGVTQVIDQLNVMVAAPVAAAPLPSADTRGAVATTGTSGSDPRSDDATIISGIQAKYFLDDRLKSRRIDVHSGNGVVTLRGEVGSDDERAQALLLARTTRGVQRVEDNMTVVIESQSRTAPASSEAIPTPSQEAVVPPSKDTALAARVEAKLSSDILLKSADIQVTARDGFVLLEGTAPTLAAKQRALALARGAEGVTQVADRVHIQKQSK